MANLADAQTAMLSPAGAADLDLSIIGTKLVLVIDSRELARACLVFWLDGLGKEFEAAGAADIRPLLNSEQLTQASAIIFSMGAGSAGEAWLAQQVDCLRKQRNEVPVIAVLDGDGEGRGQALVTRLSLQGCIPTSSTPEIARAALRLVLVGGSYLPPPTQYRHQDEAASCEPELRAQGAVPKLTPREVRVLELLMHGTANKIIAYRLGMSQSTVKVHVHSIIRKFKVRNRTEVAVIAREMLPAAKHSLAVAAQLARND